MNCSEKECCYYGQPKASSCECKNDKKVNNGGPAFPTMRDERNAYSFGTEDGMTLRDYFAAQAMCAAEGIWEGKSDDAFMEMATSCYRIADALLRAREAA